MIRYGYVGGGLFSLIFWGLCLVAFVVGLVFFIIFLVRASKRAAWHVHHPGAMGEPSAKDILQARYAKGEITQAEYKKILDDLEK